MTSGSRMLESGTSGFARGSAQLDVVENIVTLHQGNLWTTGNTNLNLNSKDIGLLTAESPTASFQLENRSRRPGDRRRSIGDDRHNVILQQ
ncbi:MAG: hypothetical protein AAGA30_16295 [Planctomycetota bacterium]